MLTKPYSTQQKVAPFNKKSSRAVTYLLEKNDIYIYLFFTVNFNN